MPAATFELTRAHQGLDKILAWVTLTLDGTRYPWAGQAIADPADYEDGYKAARLMLVEDIVLALSDRTGAMQATQAIFTLSDIPDPLTGDSVVRKWLGEHKTLRGATIDIKFLTDAQRRLGYTPQVAFRGRVERYSGPAGFQARFECQGIVGSRLGQPVVDDTIGRHFAGAPAASAGLPLPLAFGSLRVANGCVTPVHVGQLLDVFSTTWEVFVYAAHACDIATPPDLFIVDNSTGVVTPVDPAEFGVTWTVAGRTGYTTRWGSDPYYTDGLGHRWMIIAVQGPDGFNLANGTTSLRANVLGAEPVGDCSGTVITSVYEQLALIVDNLAFLSETSALGGNWRSSPPTFDDGTVKRDTASWTLAEANAFDVLAGPDGARFVSEPIVFGDLIAEILRSGHARAGVNAAGQFQLVVMNATQDRAADVTDALEILHDSFSWSDDDQLGFANAQPYALAPSYTAPGAAPTLVVTDTIEDAASQSRYQERKQADRLDMQWRLDPSQGRAVAVLELAETAEIPRQLVLQSGIHWATLKLGDIIGITHKEGPQNGGWVSRGAVILGQSISLGSLQVQLTCLDYPGVITSSSVSSSSSLSLSPSASVSPSASPSSTPSQSVSPSSSVSSSPSPGASPSVSPSSSVSSSVSKSASPSVSPSSSMSHSISPSASMSPSSSQSRSPSPSSSVSPSPSSSVSSSVSPSSSPSDSPSDSPSESPSPSASPSDSTPDEFGWPDQAQDAGPFVDYTSDTITPTGFDIPVTISITSDATFAGYSINGGAFTASPGTLNPGDTVTLNMNANIGATHCTVTIGGTTGTWTILGP